MLRPFIGIQNDHIDNSVHKSCRTLQNKVTINEVLVQLTLI